MCVCAVWLGLKGAMGGVQYGYMLKCLLLCEFAVVDVQILPGNVNPIRVDFSTPVVHFDETMFRL